MSDEAPVLIDEIVPVSGSEAMRLSQELAKQEGIFVGTSSGATLAAAFEIARRSEPGTNIVCMLPDTGERYLSTPLFDGIVDDMNEAEIEISDDVRVGVAATTKGWWRMGINRTVAERDADMGRGAVYHDNRVRIRPVATG